LGGLERLVGQGGDRFQPGDGGLDIGDGCALRPLLGFDGLSVGLPPALEGGGWPPGAVHDRDLRLEPLELQRH
jgi:hypothetical protein